MQSSLVEESKTHNPEQLTTGMDKENVTEAPVDQVKADAQARRQKYPKGEALILIGNEATPAASQNDLRANFERFKKQKVEQIKYRKYVTEQTTVDKKDPAVKKRLREKFLETAKKYFGVPYAKRYFQPGEPLYDAPMFLDCCALVRQITYDMKDDLGFYLDRWN